MVSHLAATIAWVLISWPLLATAQTDRPEAVQATAAAPATQAGTYTDGRRTTGDFAKNLGRNTAGLFSTDNLGPFVIGLGATGTAMFFDDDSQRYFGGERRAKWLGDLADRIGRPYIIGPAAVTLYGLGRLSRNHQRFRDATYDITQTTLINGAFSMAIKYASHRLRPDGSDHLSFPSGHTSNAFAWATVANHYYGPEAGAPAFLAAGLIGVGRMEKNAHYLSDVVAGATLGILIARTVVREDGEPPPVGVGANLPGTTLAQRSRPLFVVSFDF